MLAFHNVAHNKNGPFVRKYPLPGKEPLITAKKNVFEVGNNIMFKLEWSKVKYGSK